MTPRWLILLRAVLYSDALRNTASKRLWRGKKCKCENGKYFTFTFYKFTLNQDYKISSAVGLCRIKS